MAGQTSDSCFTPFAIYAGRVNFGPIARRSDILVKYAGRRMPRISSSYRPISAARALRQQQTRRPPLPLLSIDERDRGTDTRTFYDAYRPNYMRTATVLRGCCERSPGRPLHGGDRPHSQKPVGRRLSFRPHGRLTAYSAPPAPN